MNQVKARVFSSDTVMPGVCLMWLAAPEIASAAQPGQFVMVGCGQDNLLRRPFSAHRVNEDRSELALLFAEVGRGTQWLCRQKEGSTIDILGPLGNGFTINPASHNLLLVAGGIGIAPLFFLADAAIKQGKNVTLLMGAATGEQLCPGSFIHRSINCSAATDDGSAGYCGFITDLLPEYINRANQIFACGPSPMYRTMAKMPELKGKPVQVSLEVRMGCGFGVCYGCTVKTKQGLKQVCHDGPVFNLSDILWDELADI